MPATFLQVLSAVEFLDRESFELVAGHNEGSPATRPDAAAPGAFPEPWPAALSPGFRDPLDTACRHYMVVELSGSNETHDSEKLERFLESVMGEGAVVDGADRRVCAPPPFPGGFEDPSESLPR